jgi:enoyl-CoA hydratase
MTEEKSILFEIEDGIALITLNRPEKRNCFNQDMLIHLFNCLDKVHSDEQIRVAIITGMGKSFSSGLDLNAFAEEELIFPRSDGKDLFDVMRACIKPIIGAVNGYAITGGFELALHCDFLIASENASFADTHVRYGLHPAWGITQLLQRIVGRPMAKQISFTGEFVSAPRALALGLVNEVVPPEELIPRAKEIAKAIAIANQEALYTVKNLIESGGDASLSEGLVMERKGFSEWYQRISRKE